MKTLIISVSIAISAFISLPPAFPAEPLKLGDLEVELLAKNPRIRAAGKMAEAARHAVSPAGWIDDPIFSYGYFGESIQTRVGPQKNLFQLNQKLPLAKLSLKGEIAGRGAGAVEETAEAIAWEVLTDFRKGYFDLWWVEQALRITTEEMDLVERLEEIAQSKYAAGQATQQDVLKAQLRLSRLKDRELIFVQQRRTLAARLNRLLDRPVDTLLEPTGELEPFALDFSLDTLYEIAREERSSLRARGYEVEKADSTLDLARREYIPDLTLGARYYQIGSGETTSPDDGTDAWLVTVGINLPIWFWAKRGEIDEASARLEAARESYRAEVNETEFAVKDGYFKVATAREQVELYRGELLPRARQAFDASRAGYEAGRVDFLDLLDSEEALLKVQLAQYRSIADYRKYLAELEEAVGKRLINDE